MNDTSADIARLVRARYAAMSGATRVAIGADMFETARARARLAAAGVAGAGGPPAVVRTAIRDLAERIYRERDVPR